jgi:hypothetical protein
MAFWGKRLFRVMGVFAACTVILLLLALSQARVSATPGGVDRQLLVPVPAAGTLAIPLYAATGADIGIDGFLDGPVVRPRASGASQVQWFCERQTFSRLINERTFAIACGGMTHRFAISGTKGGNIADPHKPMPMPDRVAVLSDLEGNRAFLNGALKETAIIDASGNWAFGDGHLVILGDAVDRGRDVFQLLWTLYRLADQASAAGGAVHLVHGNHEQYILRGNYSRAHIEHVYALKRMGGVKPSFSEDTVIGDWLRQQPVALQMGDTIFVHGGIDAAQLTGETTIQSLNRTSREYWQGADRSSHQSALRDLVFGYAGITQYRGYLMPMDGLYAMASTSDVAGVLRHFSANRIIIGHTIVERITPLFAGRVYAVNVNSDVSRQEMLMLKRGVPEVWPLASKRNLVKSGATTERPFRMFDADDWKILWSVWISAREISAIPHPY